MKFFSELIKFVNSDIKGRGVYLDVEDITYLSTDSIMYILAISKKIKTIKKYSISGNSPRNIILRRIFESSGFLQYVYTNKNESDIFRSNDLVEIRTGDDANVKVARSICDFVIEKVSVERKNIQFLYDMIIELMINTKNHAYLEESQRVLPNWYIFVENRMDVLNFTFLDTGSGIPETVNTKFKEKIFSSEHNVLIMSALEGKFRTRTRMENRGKGLPEIYGYYKQKLINSLVIISNKGYIDLNKGNNYDMEHILEGTLFYWEINKNSLKERF